MDSKIIDRVRKLMALAGSPNAHEAAQAAAKVQSLLLEHNLRMQDIDVNSHDAERVTELVYYFDAPKTWQIDLANVISHHYFCRVLRAGVSAKGSDVMFLIGRPSNVEVLHYVWEVVLAQIETASKLTWNEVLAKHQVAYGKSFFKTYSNAAARRTRWFRSFYHGAVLGVDALLRERAQAQAAQYALVRTSNEATEYVERHHTLVQSRASNAQVDNDAILAGRDAGISVQINQGLSVSNPDLLAP